jgi:Tfp pilus assembly protein PilX
MKNKITTVMLLLLAAFITIGGNTSCKSKKRLAKEAAEAEYKARVAEAVRDLTAILDDETTWTLEEKEHRVQTIKDWNLQNAEVDDLLFQVEKKLSRERAQAAQRAEEERRAAEEAARAQQPKNVLERNLASIASASSTTQANRLINETLQLFANNNVPVLIIITQAGGFNDYDKPTTIENYLNYVKDQKVNRNKVNDLKFNDAGKITEVELIKR